MMHKSYELGYFLDNSKREQDNNKKKSLSTDEWRQMGLEQNESEFNNNYRIFHFRLIIGLP